MIFSEIKFLLKKIIKSVDKEKKIVSLHAETITVVGVSVAQQVEHIPFKDGVLGSNPSWNTKRIALWCNGSIPDSGPVSQSSSLCRATIKKESFNLLSFFHFQIHRSRQLRQNS